ncbi:hypothetical protein SESBI_39246 [Sesbania bispinosa]|nr:hypothetical protein SESBI_39246 [Sesbania bispinosa]
MLTQFFALNQRYPESRKYLYKEILENSCWHQRDNEWYPRRSKKKVIGQIYIIYPIEGEKFYLHVLLSHWGKPSFSKWHMLSHIQKAAEHWGFLQSDSSIRECLVETSILQMPCALRRLFAIVLIVWEPTDIRHLWDEFYSYMVEKRLSFDQHWSGIKLN